MPTQTNRGETARPTPMLHRPRGAIMVLNFLNDWTAVRRPCWAVFPVTEEDAALRYATAEGLGLQPLHSPRELAWFLRNMLTLGYTSALLREGVAGRPLDAVALMDAARTASEQECASR